MTIFRCSRCYLPTSLCRCPEAVWFDGWWDAVLVLLSLAVIGGTLLTLAIVIGMFAGP
jgi:hypothetical protein